ncbi:MAG TPA: hypothetical protein VNO20_05335 [Solirubrobacterales bacterium]|nr:hypothetical protein [Solirubrobacterales bacterium]
MRHLKRHLSVANLISCIALFVALSSVAYAATNLARNSVKPRHIARGAVTTPKLRNGAVTTLKLRNGAVVATKIAPGQIGTNQLSDGGVRSADLGGGVVTEGKIKNGAVTESKLASNAVSTGKLENGAVTSAKLSSSLLAQLTKNVSYVTKASGIIPIDYEKITADCPSGKQAIGGGARLVGETKKVALIESTPAVDGTGNRIGWTAAATEFAEEAADWTLEVTAVCAEL